MRYSEAYERYEAALKRLHELSANEELESPEAEVLRAEMDSAWKGLMNGERTLLRGLSADLYSFSNEEIAPSDAFLNDAALMQVAQEQHESGHWAALLDTLRASSRKFPTPILAYMRGRCWKELGRPEAAFWFFELAHRLDPSQPNYELLALDAMFRSSRKVEAVSRALSLLSTQAGSPPARFGAARVVSEVAAKLPSSEAASLYKMITNSLSAALRLVATDTRTSVVPSLLLAARLNLAIAHERLGEADKARREYDETVAQFPGRDEIIIARAMFLLGTDRAAALRDLRDLVHRNTANVYPYFFLAHDALVEEHYEKCIELCEWVLRNASNPLIRAHALEWTAISAYERGASIAAARAMLQEAVYLAPFDAGLLNNFRIAEGLNDQRKPTSAFTVEQPISPVEVTNELQTRLSMTNTAPAHS